MTNKGFIYSFWTKNNKLLYLGKTEGTLLDRLRTHSHCPKEVYKQTDIIKFFPCSNPIILDVVEKILINSLQPEYNIRDYYEEQWLKEFLTQTNFTYNYTWQELPSEIFHFNSTPEEIRQRQIEGIQKAKMQGKYKGRSPNYEKRQKFIELLPSNLSGERTALSICKELDISPNSFYRWKAKYEKGELLKNDK